MFQVTNFYFFSFQVHIPAHKHIKCMQQVNFWVQFFQKNEF